MSNSLIHAGIIVGGEKSKLQCLIFFSMDATQMLMEVARNVIDCVGTITQTSWTPMLWPHIPILVMTQIIAVTFGRRT
jgi:hypothetical protein